MPKKKRQKHQVEIDEILLRYTGGRINRKGSAAGHGLRQYIRDRKIGSSNLRRWK